MSWELCSYRECKLGWGYNEFLDLLIPVKGNPPNVTSKTLKNENSYVVISSNLALHSKIHDFFEPKCRKHLDFLIVFDNREYWELHFRIYTRIEKCKKLHEYPLTCTHFVNQIKYGIYFIITFPKLGFPQEKDEVENLFGEMKFSEIQMKVKCKVLLNYNEVSEMTLEEFVEWILGIYEKRSLVCDIPIHFSYEKLKQKGRKVTVNNDDEFGFFLSYLYCIYRKIEMKMEKVDYPDVLKINYSEKSFLVIERNLQEAKEKYHLMNRDDFLEMYSILKTLFYSYLDYIKYALDNLIVIDGGNSLPGNLEDLEEWFNELDEWFPIQHDGKWYNCMEAVIFTNSKNSNIVQKLQKAEKFKNTELFVSSDLKEPLIGTETNRHGFKFGFVDMSSTEEDEEEFDLPIFEMKCLQSCSSDLRRWICIECGDFVRSKSVGQIILFCSCGKKHFEASILRCHQCQDEREEISCNVSDDFISMELATEIKKPQGYPNDHKAQNLLSGKLGESMANQQYFYNPPIAKVQPIYTSRELQPNTNIKGPPVPPRQKIDEPKKQLNSIRNKQEILPKMVIHELQTVQLNRNKYQSQSFSSNKAEKPEINQYFNNPTTPLAKPTYEPADSESNINIQASPVPPRRSTEEPKKQLNSIISKPPIPPVKLVGELKKVQSCENKHQAEESRNQPDSDNISVATAKSIYESKNVQSRINISEPPVPPRGTKEEPKDQPGATIDRPSVSVHPQQNINVLDSILNQFRKYDKRGRSNEQMDRAIEVISERKSKSDIKIALKTVRRTSKLDGDTVQLINHYLTLD